jgi:glycosyltransferase involved in cell wall biosynthesis
MRVLQIIPSLDQAGAEKQMTLLACGLPRSEFDVHVCVLTRTGPLEQPLRQHGIELVFIRKKWKVDPAAYWRLKQEIARLKPDLVHTWVFAANCYGRCAARHAGVRRVIAGERCVDLWKRWHELAIDRYLARYTDWIATNSTGVVDFYAQHGIPREKFVVIPNGVLPPAEPLADRQELLAELKLPPESRLIGAVGRLWPQKRYRDMIIAADLVRILHPQTHLLIFGDGPERRRLERFSEELGVAEHVHWMGHRSDVARWLPHLDCFWNASGYEGQSNALMEAMACGVPVIASDIAGNRDLIIDGQTGLLFPVGQRTRLAALTRQVLEQPQWARQLGTAARTRMLEEFSVERMVNRYADLYRRTVEG